MVILKLHKRPEGRKERRVRYVKLCQINCINVHLASQLKSYKMYVIEGIFSYKRLECVRFREKKEGSGAGRGVTSSQ